MPILDVDGSRIHVLDEGAGTPVLFLHGNPDTGALWRGLVDRLRPHHRCIVPDLPGYGLSTAAPNFDCSLESLARFVDALVQQLDLQEPLNLVVHDIGGSFGLAWAVRHPQRVRRITIFNTAFSPDYRWTPLHRLWRTPWLGELVQQLTSRRAFAREMRKGTSRLTAEQVDRIHDRITPSMKRMALRFFRTLELSDFAGWDEELRALATRVPMQVLWSDDDPYIAPEFAERFGARTVRRYRGYGHWLPLEATELVATEIAAFLAAPDD